MVTSKNVAMTVGVVGLMIAGVGCSQATPNGSASNSSLSTGQLYQNPQAYCTVSAGGQLLLTVSNLTNAANYSVPPTAPVAVTVNCSGSQASSGTPISYKVSQDGGVSFQSFAAGSTTTLSFANAGTNSLAIKLTDGANLSTTVNFTLPVSCSVKPAISLNTAGLSVSQGAGGPGYNNITLPAATGGSGHGFQYQVDFNGDGKGLGRFDYYTAPNSSTPVLWSTAPSWQNVYNFYSGSRNIYVTVFDLGCQYEQSFTIPYNWSTGVLSGAQAGPMNQIPASEPYYYLQGNVASLSNSNDPAEAVTPFDAREQGTAAEGVSGQNYLHVVCSWNQQANQGSFNIQAQNTYSDGVSNDTAELTQDMALSFTIPDDMTSTTLGPQTVNLSSMNYQTAASPDGNFNQYKYAMNSGCSAYVQVQRISSPTTCTSGQGGYQWSNATIAGTFSCPNLASSGSTAARNISINNGYFYCQVGPGTNCVGGGQEGGTPPTPF